jgi:hypothetical protein
MTTVRTRLGVLATTGAIAVTGLVAGAATASAAAATAPVCGNASLAVTRTFVDGAAGSSFMSLIYRNTSGHRCTVTGYPGLDAIGRRGQVLAHAHRVRAGHRVRTITIRPGHYASAGVQWENFNGATGGDCRFSRSINTVVPNTGRVHSLAVSVSRCGLQVHPTVAGIPGRPGYGPAQHDWIRGSRAIAVNQGHFFRAAARQLNRSGDVAQQVKELRQLASLPETGLTHKQRKEARADVRELDEFFGTPGLYH